MFITILGLSANSTNHGPEELVNELRNIFFQILGLSPDKINVYVPVELSRNSPGNNTVRVIIETTTSAYYNKLVADGEAVAVFKERFADWAKQLRTLTGLKMSVSTVIKEATAGSFIF